MLQFSYNPRKAAQAAAYLVGLSGGQLSVLALMKLLYLADRKCLVSRGRPITGDRMVSMPHGPVLSRIYDEIKWGRNDAQPQPWFEYLTERQGNVVALSQSNAPTSDLSEFERQVLGEVHAQYAHFSPWELRRITHELPEYEDPQGSSAQIDPTRILRAEGWDDDDIQDAVISAREESFLEKVVG